MVENVNEKTKSQHAWRIPLSRQNLGVTLARGVLTLCCGRGRIESESCLSSAREVTQLLRAWSGGDGKALDKLTPLVYEELHRAARRLMAREQPGHTLQATALINEVYLRLVALNEVDWRDRAHFFAVCAQLMRHILTDWARKYRYLKRGGGARQVSLDQALMLPTEPEADLVALDDALTSLAAIDARKCQVVELRFYGGLSVEETAEVLKVSEGTVARDWRVAKLWLLRHMSGEEPLGA